MLNLKIYAKKGKNSFAISKFIQKSKQKKKARFLEFFAPVFAFSTSKFMTKMQKKGKKKFQIKKKVENNI